MSMKNNNDVIKGTRAAIWDGVSRYFTTLFIEKKLKKVII